MEGVVTTVSFSKTADLGPEQNLNKKTNELFQIPHFLNIDFTTILRANSLEKVFLE